MLSTTSKTIVVNPTKYDKEQYRKALDLSGNIIVYSEKGTVVQDCTFYRRLIKAGDLVQLQPKAKPAKKSPKPDNQE